MAPAHASAARAEWTLPSAEIEARHPPRASGAESDQNSRPRGPRPWLVQRTTFRCFSPATPQTHRESTTRFTPGLAAKRSCHAKAQVRPPVAQMSALSPTRSRHGRWRDAESNRAEHGGEALLALLSRILEGWASVARSRSGTSGVPLSPPRGPWPGVRQAPVRSCWAPRASSRGGPPASW
jgi:hypothetical protein